MLNLVKIQEHFTYYESLIKLNDEAFPIDERESVDNLIKYSNTDTLDFTAIFDDNIFVGFYVVIKSFNVAYLYYLAIDKNLRSNGYGSKVLAEISKVYANYSIVVDLEVIDHSAENIVQRIKRYNFYIKNGYKETDVEIIFRHTRLKIMYYNTFDKENFIKLVDLINNVKQCITIIKI